jgi:tRNA threonylcarbamoyladenosine biosynthesis protein TsaB
VRVLAIETSSRRGSVAIAERGICIAVRSHAELKAHAERMLPFVEALLGEAGWPRSSLERIAVGVGPGSFTGVRVGMALGLGIGLGLGIPVVGVPSLAAMAGAVPATHPGTRWAVLDARRGEVFLAAYAENGSIIAAPFAVPVTGASAAIDRLTPEGPRVVVGEAARELGILGFASDDSDLPHARAVARIGAGVDPAFPLEPIYVRDAGADPQELPPSPLDAS